MYKQIESNEWKKNLKRTLEGKKGLNVGGKEQMANASK